MAAFGTDALTQHPLDFDLARDGGVALFRLDRLDVALGQLTALGYAERRVTLFQADERTMHRRFQEQLNFPDHFGHNLAALDECLGDVAAGEFGWDAASAGLVVAVFGFHDLAGRDPELAQELVDSLVRTSREGLLFGHRVLWLLEAGSVEVNLQPVASRCRPWTPPGRKTGSTRTLCGRRGAGLEGRGACRRRWAAR